MVAGCESCKQRGERGEANALVCLECFGLLGKGQGVEVEVTGTFRIKVKPRL